MISSMRLFPQPFGQHFPPTHQIAQGDRLFRVNDHEGAKGGDFGGHHRHGLVDWPAGQPIRLIEAERVPGQDDSLVGLFISHGESIVRLSAGVNGRRA